MSERYIELGLGLIGIGREWPLNSGVAVPPEDEVQDFLRFSYDIGVRFYDTASSYGLSEERFGRFLDSLTPEERTPLMIATKFGEHWHPETGTTSTDHSYDALMPCLERSLNLLTFIDILQVHKASTEALKNPGLHLALREAQRAGVSYLGVSVSDLDTAKLALDSDIFDYIQFPYNVDNQTFKDIFKPADLRQKMLLINRPFNTGARLEDPYKFVLEQDFDGVVLTGTKSKAHLLQNWNSFQEALNDV